MTSLPEISCFAIEVPEDAYYFGTTILLKNKHQSLTYCRRILIGLHFVDLPIGQWQLIQPKVVSAFTEEDARGVVEFYIAVEDNGHYTEDWFKDYTDVQQILGRDYNLDSAKASLQSLLTKHNLDENKIILLTKK